MIMVKMKYIKECMMVPGKHLTEINGKIVINISN